MIVDPDINADAELTKIWLFREIFRPDKISFNLLYFTIKLHALFLHLF